MSSKFIPKKSSEINAEKEQLKRNRKTRPKQEPYYKKNFVVNKIKNSNSSFLILESENHLYFTVKNTLYSRFIYSEKLSKPSKKIILSPCLIINKKTMLICLEDTTDLLLSRSSTTEVNNSFPKELTIKQISSIYSDWQKELNIATKNTLEYYNFDKSLNNYHNSYSITFNYAYNEFVIDLKENFINLVTSSPPQKAIDFIKTNLIHKTLEEILTDLTTI